jgi:hypothetical protein
MFQRIAHQMRKLIGIHRLGDVIIGAEFEGLHRRFHRRIAGHDDHREVRICLSQTRLQFHAVRARHLNVAQHNVELRLPDSFRASRAPPVGLAEKPSLVNHSPRESRTTNSSSTISILPLVLTADIGSKAVAIGSFRPLTHSNRYHH